MSTIDVRELAKWYTEGWDMETLEEYAIDALVEDMKEYPEFYNDLLKQYKEHNDEINNE